jgi:hypothetical protein
MFKKINFKSIFVGIIIGIVLMSSVFAGEEIVQYIFTQSPAKLIVDNVEYSNPDIPITLFMKDGSNFAPVAVIRDLCTKLGIDFVYDSATKEIRITTTGTTTNTIGKEENILGETTTTTTENTENITYENGLTIKEVNGIKYIDAISFMEKYEPLGYKLFIAPASTYNLEKDEKVILTEIERYNGINVKELKNRHYIKYDEYINTIKPLIGE